MKINNLYELIIYDISKIVKSHLLNKKGYNYTQGHDVHLKVYEENIAMQLQSVY